MSELKTSETPAKFVDCTGVAAPKLDLWPAIVIPKAAIEAEIETLARLPAPQNGRRSALIVHPYSKPPGLGLAPGIQVSINVLQPGERTKPIRHNSTQVNFCIRGRGHSIITANAWDSNVTMYGIPRRWQCIPMLTTATRCK